MEIHELKIQSEYFEVIKNGTKKFELRKDDRNYQVGDFITLREYDGDRFTGRGISNIPINYILRNCPEYGLKNGYCILGF